MSSYLKVMLELPLIEEREISHDTSLLLMARDDYLMIFGPYSSMEKQTHYFHPWVQWDENFS